MHLCTAAWTALPMLVAARPLPIGSSVSEIGVKSGFSSSSSDASAASRAFRTLGDSHGRSLANAIVSRCRKSQASRSSMVRDRSGSSGSIA